MPAKYVVLTRISVDRVSSWRGLTGTGAVVSTTGSVPARSCRTLSPPPAYFPAPPPLLLRRSEEPFRAPQRLHIQIRHIGARPLGANRDTDLKVGAEQHVVLPQAASAVEDAQQALLHLHLRREKAPAGRVVLALLAPGPGVQRHSAFGVSKAALRALLHGRGSGVLVVASFVIFIVILAVDRLGGLFLLHEAQHAVIEVLVDL